MAAGAGGSGVGKAARELMQEMQKAQEQVNKMDEQKGPGASGTTFDQTMQAQMAQAAQQINAPTEAQKILAQAKVDASNATKEGNQAAKEYRSWFADTIKDVVGGQDKMGKIMDMALSGRQFSPVELIGMQAGVYRFAQELELTSKVVEKATGGIKQTMNTQV